jgi:hypothetical protein
MRFGLSEARIRDVTAFPVRQYIAIATLPFELRYTHAGSGTQLFLGTELEDLVRFDMVQQVGIRQNVWSAFVLQAGLLVSGIPTQVWEDPFLENRQRISTRRNSAGARVSLDRLLGKTWMLRYTWRSIQIDSERSGEGSGLPPGERLALMRNGDIHEFELRYGVIPHEGHMVSPSLIYTADRRMGRAVSRDVYDLQVQYRWSRQPFLFISNIITGYSIALADHPVFGETAEYLRLGISAAGYWTNPMGWKLPGAKPFTFILSVGFYNEASSIRFYEREAFMVTAGILSIWP